MQRDTPVELWQKQKNIWRCKHEPRPPIRQEQPADYAQVETLIRRAFWNLYIPGCVGPYLARIIRPHPDFLPELDLVLELDGEVIGSIMYTKARLVEDSGAETPFSPSARCALRRSTGAGATASC